MTVRGPGKVENREVGEVESSKIRQLNSDREAYSSGTPVSTDTYEEGGHVSVPKSQVGFKQVLPLLDEKEDKGIAHDLKYIADGIKLYEHLDPDLKKDISKKKFACAYAMCEAFRKAIT